MKTIHKTAISAVAAGLLSGLAYTPVFAADEPEASPITANVTVVSDYRYRGLTQSNFKPAIQGGFDYAHESGFYIGNWNSSISWISDGYAGTTPGVSAPIEMDFYAGYKKELIGEGFATDFGFLQYYYPVANLPSNTSNASTASSALRQGNGVSPNTTEAYIAQNFTFGPVTGFAKFSYALSNIFGIYNSNGSYYPDLTVNYDTGIWGVALNGHVGYQYISNNKPGYDYSYTDWKLGVTKDFGGGLSGALAYVGTNAGKAGTTYLYAAPSSTPKNQGKGGGVISLTKTF
ncbi:TorF family putative porin [Polynucleobacter sp. UB-Siik-W21]|uniref:TorF family putative porin n=1 Tax=Polynucleobacter sp. UB-Siik-W21 TaxID=1855646 RepID=UPI001BFE3369|nr:TorF family putative porin [Polynucleobacter sp. UB-Siik-W21]QWD70262.1 hypothetical protein C2756_10230 [Polynucleobacter sp. UB-Siik-W21]